MCTNVTNSPEYTCSLDNVQRHILGVIIGLMSSFGITPEHTRVTFEYFANNEYDGDAAVMYAPVDQTSKHTTEKKHVPISSPSWADMCDDDDQYCKQSEKSEPNDITDSNDSDSIVSLGMGTTPVYVSTRGQFCTAMQKRIRICPRYSTCVNTECENFHIKPEHICPHVVRGSYCDNKECELIVIRPCRKGKKCTNSECSFRH